MSPNEQRARNLMSTAAHALANAVRTEAYPDCEAFHEAFSAALTARLELIDGKQEPMARAWLAALQKRVGVHGERR